MNFIARLSSILTVLFPIILVGQLSFYDEDPFYEGDSQNSYFTRYALNYDFNNDGFNDILHLQNNSLYVTYGSATGYENEELVHIHSSYLTGFSKSSDLNDDGRLDFVINTSTEILVFHGTTDGIELSETLTDSEVRLVNLIDLNKDGIVDIIYNSYFDIYYAEGLSTGGYSNAVSLTENVTEIASSYNFEITDIDGDSDLDFLVLDINNSRLYSILNSDFTFSADKFVSASDTHFTFGDYDLDGINDVAVLNSNGEIEVYLNNESSFDLSHTYATFNVSALISYDYNSNGRPDIIVSNRMTDMTLLVNNGDGTFAEPDYIVSEMERFGNPVLDDFNNDGLVDIIGMGANAFNEVVFVPLSPQVSPTNPFITYSLRPDPGFNAGNQLGDLDEDGFQDLVIFSQNGAVYVFYGTNEGFETNFYRYATHPFTTGGIIKDVDGDNHLDLIIRYQSASNGTIGTEKYINLLNRQFDASSPFKFLTSLEEVQFSDYDQDGVENIISTFDNDVVFLTVDEGNYDEYYTANPLKLQFSAYINELKIEDIDGDSWPDAIVGIQDSKDISLYINNQSGGFDAPTLLALEDGEYPTSISIFDLDNDNIEELIVATANNSGYKVKIYSRTSYMDAFSLSETIDPSLTQFIETIFIEDFDGDGLTDMLVSPFAGITGSFILQQSDGTWIVNSSAVDEEFNNVLADDITNDGLIDLVRIEPSGGPIKLTFNNSVFEPAELTSEVVSIEQADATIQITLNEHSSNGRIVLVKEGSAVDAVPADGTFYAQNGSFGVGTEIGAGNFVVYAGTENSFTISNLESLTDYHLAIFDYNSNEPQNDLINYLTSSSANSDFAIQIDQTLSATGIQDYLTKDESFEVTATASSGLTVDLSIGSGPATIENGIVTITGDGVIVINAVQAGDKYYYPVEESYEITVTKENQELTATGVENHFVSEGTFTLEVASSSGLDVDVSVVSGPITLENGVATITGDGTVMLLAVQSGDFYFYPVEETYEFIISKEDQVLTYENLMDVDFELGTFEIVVTSSVGLDVALEVISGPITLDGSTATILDYGTVVINATQAGNEAYLPASETFEFDIIEVLGLDNSGVYTPYPNPTTSYIQFKIDISNLEIDILDLEGKSQSFRRINANEIDLSELKTGIYILKVIDKGKSAFVRIIKE